MWPCMRFPLMRVWCEPASLWGAHLATPVRAPEARDTGEERTCVVRPSRVSVGAASATGPGAISMPAVGVWPTSGSHSSLIDLARLAVGRSSSPEVGRLGNWPEEGVRASRRALDPTPATLVRGLCGDVSSWCCLCSSSRRRSSSSRRVRFVFERCLHRSGVESNAASVKQPEPDVSPAGIAICPSERPLRELNRQEAERLGWKRERPSLRRSESRALGRFSRQEIQHEACAEMTSGDTQPREADCVRDITGL